MPTSLRLPPALAAAVVFVGLLALAAWAIGLPAIIAGGLVLLGLALTVRWRLLWPVRMPRPVVPGGARLWALFLAAGLVPLLAELLGSWNTWSGIFGAGFKLALVSGANLLAGAWFAARLCAEARQAEQTRGEALSQRLISIQEDERRHLARELHDEVGQALTGLRLSLELVSRLPAAEREARLADARASVQELTGRVRALSLNLRPAMLDDMGLLPALLWQIKRYTEQTGIAVDIRYRGLEQRPPPEVETVAYRVVQEALTNVARHAGVCRVEVRLLARAAHLCVQVSDEGQGFDPCAALASGRSRGLAGMRERVALLGGTLTIDSAPGEGTVVTVDLPLVTPARKEEAGDHAHAGR